MDEEFIPILEILKELKKITKNLEKLTTKENTSEWVEKEVISIKDTGIEEVQSARCRKCGIYQTQLPYMYYIKNYNYCPNCGAKMESEAENG